MNAIEYRKMIKIAISFHQKIKKASIKLAFLVKTDNYFAVLAVAVAVLGTGWAV